MPTLENLRKQAKLYLRWHRDGHHPVAAEIRAVLPRYRHLTDRQVLEGSFKLGDAQELVARQSGFESWQALKTGVHVMTDTAQPTLSSPVLSGVEAQLFVADVAASCAYYTSKLGFAVVFAYREPPFYAQVRRDKARLNLRLVHGPVFVGNIREREHLPVGHDDPRECGRNPLAFRSLPLPRRRFPPATQEGALGCADFRPARSRR